MTASYPSSAAERTRWILARRGERNPIQADRPYAFFCEPERSVTGAIQQVATIFLTNRECPWKCVMCDLWRNTTERAVTAEEIEMQIDFALDRLPHAPILKLYNSGSFFDQRAIPRAAWPKIKEVCRRFEHLIVECHPKLVNQAVIDFASSLPCTFEVALGLETAHAGALQALNKGITLEDYRRALGILSTKGIKTRTFLLVHPPFVPRAEEKKWIRHSIRVALDSGSTVVSLIPLRPGNGSVEALVSNGSARIPTLKQLEEAHELGISCGSGRVFADTWDLELFSRCDACLEERTARLQRINLSQIIEERVMCRCCAHG